MSTPFYSRYIPPKLDKSAASSGTVDKSTTANPDNGGEGIGKRKRDAKDSKSSKKAKKQDDVKVGRKKQYHENDPEDMFKNEKSELGDSVNTFVNGSGVSGPSQVEADQEPKEQNLKSSKINKTVSGSQKNQTDAKEQSKKSKAERKKSKIVANSVTQEPGESVMDTNGDNGEEDDNEVERRHAHIMTKFKKSLKIAKPKAEEKPTGPQDSEKPMAKELKPFPAPERINMDAGETTSHRSSLPHWLSEPLVAKADDTKPLKSLHINDDFVKLLAKKEITTSLPVQSACLPLLLPTENQYPGDICVSAATGSGKTLAYALPIVQDLACNSFTKLRALIIVPTRELVNQVRETFGLLVPNTALKIGTATGNQPLKDEQNKIVQKDWKYDPAKYHRIQDKFRKRRMPEDDADTERESEDENDDQQQDTDFLFEHVQEFISNIDILICTPGRLVEHIKSTKGFDLSGMSWLVIDEADKLLDESFQEWTDILLRQIDQTHSKRPPKLHFHDSFLSNYILPRPIQRVRKVVLSATMTKDLDKLNTLKLQIPKLVLLEGGEETSVGASARKSASDILTLPSTLQEFVVSVGDGSEKPLYLLQLLDKIFERQQTPSEPSDPKSKEHAKMEDADGSSFDSSSSEGSGSLPSGATSSDSDSESDSDSLSSSSSSSSSVTSPHPNPISSDSSSKPTAKNTALIFTTATESTARLSALLRKLTPYNITTLTKTTTSASTRALKTFLRPSSIPKLLLATDRAARGLDLPHLPTVINYGVPRSPTAYVHRVGRTARAGRPGAAWTLVERRESGWFWKTVARSGGGIARGAGKEVQRVQVEFAEGEEGRSVRRRYEAALEELREDVDQASRR